MSVATAYFDGAKKYNGGLGHVGTGWVLYVPELRYSGQTYAYKNKTSNEAEYLALIHLLEFITQEYSAMRGIEMIYIFGDSQLVVNQVSGAWKYNAKFEQYLTYIWGLIDRIKAEVYLSWIPRKKNFEADKLAQNAIQVKSSYPIYDGEYTAKKPLWISTTKMFRIT